MKRAKVSSVYKGTGKKRSREEEQGESRMARMKAKARKYGCRRNARAPCPRRRRPSARTIITRSMATKSKSVEEKGNQEMGEVVVVVEEEKEEKRSEINVVEETPVGGVVEMPAEGFQGLEEWPPVWNYEEEWLWSGGGMRWDPNWDVMTGDVWVGGENNVEKDHVWEVDIWNFDI